MCKYCQIQPVEEKNLLWVQLMALNGTYLLMDSVGRIQSLGPDIYLVKMTQQKEKKEKPPWLVWQSGLSMACKPTGHQFNSQLGHMPGLQARSPMGGTQEATTH